ncbi:sigma-70 family RNA polymerase sigma factor family protein [Streptosporangium soli]
MRERLPVAHTEVAHLQYPDALLNKLDSALVAERPEEVALAFIAALQLLPPTQRAVLITRGAVLERRRRRPARR